MFNKGPLLTSMQTSLLATASITEGIVNTEESKIDLKDRSVQKSKYELQQSDEYKELLINLLFGSGKIINEYLYNKIGITELIKKGIIAEIDTNKVSDRLFNNILYEYERTFNAYRRLDNDRYMSNIVSYEDIIVDQSKPNFQEINEIEESLTVIKSGRDSLRRILIPTIEKLFPIFKHYLNKNIYYYSNIFNSMQGEGTEEIKIPDVIQIEELFSQMGLKRLSAEEMENINFNLFSFTPYDMENLWFELKIGKFENLIESCVYNFMASDPHKRFFLQAFWRTIIEFNKLLKLSIDEKHYLIMSDNLIENHELIKNSNKDEIMIFKIFLSERLTIPRLESLEDLLRLKEDKRITPLKKVLSEWNYEYNTNSCDIIKIRNRIKNDLALAEKDIKKLERRKTVSSIISYICIPIGIAELFTGTPVSVIAGGLSGLTCYNADRHLKNQWLHWGLQ